LHSQLEGLGLDLEQQVAGLDLGALLEVPGLQITLDARPDLHLVDGLDPAGEAPLLREILQGDRLGDDGRRGGGRLLRGAVAATGREQECAENHCHRARCCVVSHGLLLVAGPLAGCRMPENECVNAAVSHRVLGLSEIRGCAATGNAS
jgi:hypothetical protein